MVIMKLDSAFQGSVPMFLKSIIIIIIIICNPGYV
jgi:hypothetical protein